MTGNDIPFVTGPHGVSPQYRQAMYEKYPQLLPTLANLIVTIGEKQRRSLLELEAYKWTICAPAELAPVHQTLGTTTNLDEGQYDWLFLLTETPNVGDDDKTVYNIAAPTPHHGHQLDHTLHSRWVDPDTIKWVVTVSCNTKAKTIRVQLYSNTTQLQEWRTAAEAEAKTLFGL